MLWRREDPWIWPAVWWVLVGDSASCALVFQRRVDMFWHSHALVPLSHLLSHVDPYRGAPPKPLPDDPAFWGDDFVRRCRVVSAWTGAVASTFPSASLERQTPPIHAVTMRSLMPLSSPKGPENSLRSLRERWRAPVESVVGAEACRDLIKKLAR